MARMILESADTARIDRHVRAAYRAAVAHGEGIGEAGKARLQDAVADLDAAAAADKAAESVRAEAWQVVLVEEQKSDAAIGALADDVWNTLGRPRASRVFTQLFPGGVATFSRKDPRRKPTLIQVLIDRIVKAMAPPFTPGKKTLWVAQLEERRKALQHAVEAYGPVEAAATVARAGYRSAVHAGWGRLRELKRDLQNLGLSEAAIGDIIPSDTPPPRHPAPALPTLPVVKAA